MMKLWRSLLIICAAYGWWGILYPQFTMVQDTFAVILEEDSVQERSRMLESERDGRDIYWEILGAEREKIRFKSRLLQEIQDFAEAREKGS